MNRRRGYGAPATDLPLLLILLGAGLAVWPVYDRSTCWPALAAVAAGVIIYFALSRVHAGGRLWHAAAGCTVSAAALLALYFITQYSRLGYPEKLAGLDDAATWLGRLVPPLGAWAPDRNSVATALESVLFLSAGLTLAARRRPARFAWAAAAAVIAAGLILSASRGAWLGVGAALSVWLVITRSWFTARPRAAAVAIMLPLLAGLAWLAAVVWWPEATGSGAVAPALDRPDRVTLYRQSAFLIGDYPYTGIGLGGPFAMLLSRYVLIIQVPFLTYSHNLFLQTWLELGLAGILGLVWLLTTFAVSLWLLPQLRNRTLAQAVAMGVLATFVHGLVDARPFVDPWSGVPLVVLLGLYAAHVRPAQTPPVKRQGMLLSAAVAASLVAVVALATWPVGATWAANAGAIQQGWADLGADTRPAGSGPAPGAGAAEARFRAALAAAPGNRTANLRLALIEMADGRFDAAAGHAATAWKAEPSSHATRKTLGLACVWTGDVERAQSLLRGIPGIIDELNTWGWWRSSRGEPSLAAHALRTSLLLEPDQPAVRDMLLGLKQTGTSGGDSSRPAGR